MRNVLGIALAGLFAVSIAGTASAATLSYTGTLTFGLGTLPSASGSGSAVSVGITSGGHITTLAIPGNFGPITTSLPVTASATVLSVRLTGVGNLSGTMSGMSGGAGGGPMGLQGLAKICLVFDPTCVYVNVPVPLTPTTGGAGLGVGGVQTVPGAVALTMQHAPWTAGQPAMTIHDPGSAVTTPTLPGGFGSPASATHQPSGVLQLVTVSKVFTSLTGAFPELPVFSILNLHFSSGTVPEPGTLLLVGSGIAGLVLIGRRQSRK